MTTTSSLIPHIDETDDLICRCGNSGLIADASDGDGYDFTDDRGRLMPLDPLPGHEGIEVWQQGRDCYRCRDCGMILKVDDTTGTVKAIGETGPEGDCIRTACHLDDWAGHLYDLEMADYGGDPMPSQPLLGPAKPSIQLIAKAWPWANLTDPVKITEGDLRAILAATITEPRTAADHAQQSMTQSLNRRSQQ